MALSSARIKPLWNLLTHPPINSVSTYYVLNTTYVEGTCCLGNNENGSLHMLKSSLQDIQSSSLTPGSPVL